MGYSFAEKRAMLEEEGILIGGWSMRNIVTPKKKDGKHGELSKLLLVVPNANGEYRL